MSKAVVNKKMNFSESQRKSENIFQYKCSCNSKLWWGAKANNQCRRCKKEVTPLPLKQMIGIGWFECTSCKRRYAGFSKGDVSSKCHICNIENFPLFIVSGEKADNEDKKEDKKAHYCARCKGGDHCPIVDQVKNNSSSHKSRY
jgi:hypothetical protein